MACPYSKVNSIHHQGLTFFLVWVMEFSVIFSCLSKIFPIILACQSQSTFNICMNTVIEFYVFLTGQSFWAFVYQPSGFEINSFCSYLNFRYRAWYSGNCRVYIHPKLCIWHGNNTQLKDFLLLSNVFFKLVYLGILYFPWWKNFSRA